MTMMLAWRTASALRTGATLCLGVVDDGRPRGWGQWWVVVVVLVLVMLLLLLVPIVVVAVRMAGVAAVNG
jgi:hypothetical protein